MTPRSPRYCGPELGAEVASDSMPITSDARFVFAAQLRECRPTVAIVFLLDFPFLPHGIFPSPRRKRFIAPQFLEPANRRGIEDDLRSLDRIHSA